MSRVALSSLYRGEFALGQTRVRMRSKIRQLDLGRSLTDKKRRLVSGARRVRRGCADNPINLLALGLVRGRRVTQTTLRQGVLPRQ